MFYQFRNQISKKSYLYVDDIALPDFRNRLRELDRKTTNIAYPFKWWRSGHQISSPLFSRQKRMNGEIIDASAVISLNWDRYVVAYLM